ncbi:MAG: helix-turn-helix domain-containing protein [Azoarcus sp.]|jgi:lambda repressor-like predicted transcriptional regulator|nr:helix-turn-helix domain-containing protein [Azoarcus sp.]
MNPENQIKERLRCKGITLAAIADELGKASSTVSLVVAGKAKSYPIQRAIADRLETTIDQLWPGQIRLRRNRAEIEAAMEKRQAA